MKYHFSMVLILSFSTLIAQNIITPKPEQIVYRCPPCGCTNDQDRFDAPGECPSCAMTLVAEIHGLEIQRPTIPTPTVGMFIFDRADVMDVTGPLSVFEHAGFNIVTFGLSSESVIVGTHLEMKPEFTTDNLPDVDILVFPGGGLAESDPGNEMVESFIRDRSRSAGVLFSVCSGAFFLAEAGVLNQKQATTFATMIPLLSRGYSEVEVLDNVKYVDNGNIVTSAGLSSGIDASFHVISKYLGVGRAQDIANRMEYPWKRQNDYARSQLADRFLTTPGDIVRNFYSEFTYSNGDQQHWEYRFTIPAEVKPKLLFRIILDELQRLESWEIITTSEDQIEARNNHPSIGEGLVHLMSEKNPEGFSIIMKSKRINNPDQP